MQATTIKIENPLLSELKSVMPKNRSLTAFVKEILERDVQRRRMIESAERYSEFLKSNPEEGGWLCEWESAALEKSPKNKKLRKRRPQ